MTKTALVVLADGFEEMEAIAPVDVLRRAGIRVTVAGLSDRIVKSSRGLSVQAEMLLKDYQEDLPDVVILPGGLPGSENLAKSSQLAVFIQKMHDAQKLIAAICAAPARVLAPIGVLDGKKATCYPGCEADFSSRTVYSKDRVVVDGNIITSQGPGSALEFSLEIVKCLAGKEIANLLQAKMLIQKSHP